MPSFINISGKRYGRLTVLDRAPNDRQYTRWRCVCDCGSEKIIQSARLRRGHTKSCGCLNKEIVRERMKNNNPNWKGDNVRYAGLHYWIRAHKTRPKTCETCRTNKPLDVANISGDYKRDIDDFKWVCRRCHMESDGRLNALRGKINDAVESNQA